MVKLFDLEKDDNNFVKSILVSTERQTAIRNLKRERKIYFSSMVLMFVLFAVSLFSNGGVTVSVMLGGFLLFSMGFLYLDIRLKIVKIFEGIESRAKTNGEQ